MCDDGSLRRSPRKGMKHEFDGIHIHQNIQHIIDDRALTLALGIINFCHTVIRNKPYHQHVSCISFRSNFSSLSKREYLLRPKSFFVCACLLSPHSRSQIFTWTLFGIINLLSPRTPHPRDQIFASLISHKTRIAECCYEGILTRTEASV